MKLFSTLLRAKPTQKTPIIISALFFQTVCSTQEFIDKRKQKEQANIDITLHAVKIINSNKNMYKTLFAGSDLFQNILDKINFDCLDIFEKIRV